jgi:hypothetical protein
MTYRIDSQGTPPAAVLVFQGLLDEAALAELRVRIGAAGEPVRLVLRAGTEVEPASIEPLRRLPAELHAESPFLQRWLSEDRP